MWWRCGVVWPVARVKMPQRSRVKKPAVGRPYVERAPGDNYHSDAHCIDLDDCGWIVDSESGIHTFVGYDYTIEYVRTPHELVGTKLQVLRQGITETGCPFGVGLRYLELEHDLTAVFTGKNGIAWCQKRR